ncbi:MAG: tRNA (adenosine(37)-N6)-threonylcarbamoyltransferase complex dimerization subunit type 1 TsaB, partial [Candidatus Sumerlaeia bacterium]|nr:tRNA (adenosine(37)-N6)-threonylcarbamoyltransferase complex dimerization subunit type 1 TsaB [Candidatus Sumerlaeia bacterium]
MKILGIETSTPAGGVALLDASNGLMFSLQLNSQQTHSERLMSSIAEALSRLQLKISDLNAIAVATGPGSFTGVRIGMSVAKGLAIATQMP